MLQYNDKHLPLVSIMIPTYRQEGVILKAVESALAQDYPNLEIIVADDASPDCTSRLIASRKDPRLRYHRNPTNLGRVANYRNTLYNLATGEWVVNLDGDDYFTDPHFISMAIASILNDDDIVIVTAKHIVYPKYGGHVNRFPKENMLSGFDILSYLHSARYSFMHLATIYKRSTALTCDFYRMDVLSSDLESLYRLSLEGKVAYLDRYVGVWNKNKLNTSSSCDYNQLLSNLSIWPSIFEHAREKGFPSRRANRLLRSIISYHVYGDLCNLLFCAEYTSFVKYLQIVTKDYGLYVVTIGFLELIIKLPYRLLERFCRICMLAY